MGPLVSSRLLQEPEDLAKPMMAPARSQRQAVLWLLGLIFFQTIGIHLIARDTE